MKRYQVRVKASRQGSGYELQLTVFAESELEAKKKAISDAKNQKPGHDSYKVVNFYEMH